MIPKSVLGGDYCSVIVLAKEFLFCGMHAISIFSA